MRQLNLFYLIICLFVVLVYSASVNASVVINEVAIQPNQVVELYNTATTSADISSWYIDDAGGTTFFTIPPQTILYPQSCLLFSSDFNLNKSSSDVVRLFDNSGPPTSSSAKLVEQYLYSKAPDINYSFIKKKDATAEWQTGPSSLGLSNDTLLPCIPTPTPTPLPTEAPTSFPTNTPFPTSTPIQEPSPTPISELKSIYISEVFPYPQTNEPEWVELYNGNENQVVINHWYIDDAENAGSTPKSFSITIDPFSYGVVELTSSIFNNDGDVVRLLDINKQEKDSMEYGKINQGKSIGRISFTDDSFCEQESSKNDANLQCLVNPTQLPAFKTVSSSKATLTQKSIIPTKPTSNQKQQYNIKKEKVESSNGTPSTKMGEVLGAQISQSQPSSPAPYLSFVSFSYSLLTIVSVFIKMKYA